MAHKTIALAAELRELGHCWLIKQYSPVQAAPVIGRSASGMASAAEHPGQKSKTEPADGDKHRAQDEQREGQTRDANSRGAKNIGAKNRET